MSISLQALKLLQFEKEEGRRTETHSLFYGQFRPVFTYLANNVKEPLVTQSYYHLQTKFSFAEEETGHDRRSSFRMNRAVIKSHHAHNWDDRMFTRHRATASHTITTVIAVRSTISAICRVFPCQRPWFSRTSPLNYSDSVDSRAIDFRLPAADRSVG